MKTTKRLFAVLLALVLLCVGVPLAAQAEDGLAPTGSCGDNVTWTFEKETGLLILSGSGAMNDYTNYSKSPFYYQQAIKKLIINDGIINTGNCAFEKCTGLESVTISNSVIRIGSSSFSYCDRLTSVTLGNNIASIGVAAFYADRNLQIINLPDSVMSIADYAFYGCNNLESISIPDGVTRIGTWAFHGCSDLKSVEIPASVLSIGSEAFYGCINMFSFAVDINNNEYASDESGCLYNKEKTLLIQYPIGNDRTSFIIPNHVSTIEESAFLGCNKLSSLTISNNVTSIGDAAFCGCKYLVTVKIGSGVTKIGKYVFQDCNSLTNVYISKSVSNIDIYAFDGCGELANVLFCGSESDWTAIVINGGNNPLKNATVYYNHHSVGEPILEKEQSATCTMSSSYESVTYCTLCGEELLRETVFEGDPLGHNPQPVYTWAKDDSTVTAEMTCTRCGEVSLKETADVTTEVTVKPTCSTEGELTLIAAFNNKAFYAQTKTKVLPMDPDAHVFRVTVTPPTCLDDGYTTHACTLCRYGYSDEIVAALGHDYVNAKATGNGNGTHTLTCNRCKQPGEAIACADEDNDGKCDFCGDQMQGGDHCKYCGRIHNGNFFDKLTGFFHKIFAVFKR